MAFTLGSFSAAGPARLAKHSPRGGRARAALARSSSSSPEQPWGRARVVLARSSSSPEQQQCSSSSNINSTSPLILSRRDLGSATLAAAALAAAAPLVTPLATPPAALAVQGRLVG